MELVLLILPVFLIVFTGWLAARTKIIRHDKSTSLVEYLFFIAIPALLFYAIQKYEIKELFNLRYWFAYLLSVIVVFLLSFLIYRIFLRRTGSEAFFAGMSSSLSNVVMLGYPVMAGIIGVKAVIPMTMVIVIFNLIINPVMILYLEFQSDGSISQKIKQTTWGFFKNPFILSSVLGILFSLFSIRLPSFIDQFLLYFSASVIPLALFSVGLDMANLTLKGNLGNILFLCTINLIVRPFIVFFIVDWIGISPAYSVALIVFSAVPPAKTIYILAKKYKMHEHAAAAIITFTTIFAVITLPLVLYFCRLVWPEVFTSIHYGGSLSL